MKDFGHSNKLKAVLEFEGVSAYNCTTYILYTYVVWVYYILVPKYSRNLRFVLSERLPQAAHWQASPGYHKKDT